MKILSTATLSYNNIVNLSDYRVKSVPKQITFGERRDSLKIAPKLIKTDNLSLQRAISPQVKKLIYPLVKAAEATGNDMFIYGGFVRELLNGRPYNDIDFAISGDLETFFKGFVKGNPTLEVSHSIGYYNRPSLPKAKKMRIDFNETKFDMSTLGMSENKGLTLQEAISRHVNNTDFTISSMIIRPYFDESGKMNFEFIDVLNGYADMQKRILRLSGNSGKAFERNAARVVTAVRLQKRYNLTYDAKLKEEIQKIIDHRHFNRGVKYYCRLKCALLGLLKDNNLSIRTTFMDIMKNKLYRLV